MIRTEYFLLVLIAFILVGCGGSSSVAETPASSEIPVNISIQNVSLKAGEPTTFIYTIPAPTQPLSEVTIDLERTLEAVQITLTPTP